MAIVVEIGKEVLLHESREGVAAVFCCTIMDRILVGNLLSLSLKRSAQGLVTDLWTAAYNAPIPEGLTPMSEVGYCEAQAAALMNPSARSVWNTGMIPQGDVGLYIRTFVESDVFRTVSPKVYLLTLVFLKRAMEQNPVNTLTSFNYRRLMLAAFIVALKIVEGDEYSARNFSEVFGMADTTLDQIEQAFNNILSDKDDLNEDLYLNYGFNIILEVLDSRFHNVSEAKLRGAKVHNLDAVLKKLKLEGSHRTPPKELHNPVRVGVAYRGINVDSPSQAAALNQVAIAERVFEWENEKEKSTSLRYTVYKRVLQASAYVRGG